MNKFKIVTDIKSILEPTMDFAKKSNSKTILGVILGLYATLALPLILLILTLGFSFVISVLTDIGSDSIFGTGYAVSMLGYQLATNIPAMLLMIVFLIAFLVISIFTGFIIPYAMLNTLRDVKLGKIDKVTFDNLRVRLFSSTTGFMSIGSYIGKVFLYVILPGIALGVILVILDLIPGVLISETFVVNLVSLFLVFNLHVKCLIYSNVESKTFVNENYLVPAIIALVGVLFDLILPSFLMLLVCEILIACYTVDTIVQEEIKEVEEVEKVEEVEEVEKVEEVKEIKEVEEVEEVVASVIEPQDVIE